mmetsp:Transcript_12021/g.20377  ORF Transcript_12021/g.20377 Transcript_12021/m.20377 type:complete len:87 (+) Transcript_12021:39-299(+)
MFHDEVKGGRLGAAVRPPGWRWSCFSGRVAYEIGSCRAKGVVAGKRNILALLHLFYMSLDVQSVPYMWTVFIMWSAAAVKMKKITI